MQIYWFPFNSWRIFQLLRTGFMFSVMKPSHLNCGSLIGNASFLCCFPEAYLSLLFSELNYDVCWFRSIWIYYVWGLLCFCYLCISLWYMWSHNNSFSFSVLFFWNSDVVNIRSFISVSQVTKNLFIVFYNLFLLF